MQAFVGWIFQKFLQFNNFLWFATALGVRHTWKYGVEPVTNAAPPQILWEQWGMSPAAPPPSGLCLTSPSQERRPPGSGAAFHAIFTASFTPSPPSSHLRSQSPPPSGPPLLQLICQDVTLAMSHVLAGQTNLIWDKQSLYDTVYSTMVEGTIYQDAPKG